MDSQLHALDWTVFGAIAAVVMLIAFRTQRYMRSVSDFLAAVGAAVSDFLAAGAAVSVFLAGAEAGGVCANAPIVNNKRVESRFI